MSDDATDLEFFEALYRSNPDPWRFADNAYEQHRYDTIASAIPVGPFGTGFEPGCSIGELTVRLGPRCDGYLAIDISPTAVRRASERCAHLPHVEVRTGSLPDDVPGHAIDLLVLSEIGYYFDAPTLASIVARLDDRLTEARAVIACHWLGSSTDHVLGGHQVHDVLTAQFGAPTMHELHTGFVLDTWHPTP